MKQQQKANSKAMNNFRELFCFNNSIVLIFCEGQASEPTF